MTSLRLLAVVFGVTAGVALALGPAGPASAHADLLSSDPAAGTVVDTLPQAVTLTFSEAVQPVVDQIQVIAPDGRPATGNRMDSKPDETIRIPLRGGGPNGTYAVSYRVISDDGHPMVGVITFSVGAPSAIPPVPLSAGAPAVDGSLQLAMGAAHFVAVLGLILLVGPVLFLLRLWPTGVSRRGAGLLVRAGLVTVAVGTLAELYIQAPYGNGGTSLATTGDAIQEVLTSRYGIAHLVRLGVLAAVALPLARVIAGQAGRASRTALVALAAAGLATWPLAGHPRTSALPVVTILADAAHLGAIALWLGGLVTLLAFVLHRASEAELSRIMPLWSRWAQWAVLVLIAGGLTEALVQVPGFGPLLHTTYGQLILVKAAMLAAVLAVAEYSRRLVRRNFAATARTAMPTLPTSQPAAEPARTVAGPAPLATQPASATATLTYTAAERDQTTAGPATPAVAVADPPPAGDAATGRRPAEGPPARRRLRRAVLAEAAITIVVVAVAAALVQTAPSASAEAATDPYLTGPGVVGGLTHMGMLQNPTCMLQVRFSPATTGTNHVQLYAYNRASAPLTVEDWHGTADLPGRTTAPLDIPLTKASGSHSSGTVVLPQPGTWQLRFTLTLPGGQQTTLTGTVTIRSR